MSENNIIQEQKTEIPSAAEPSKKKIRVGFIFLAFVPMAVLMMIQTAAQFPFLMIAAAETAQKSAASVDPLDLYSEMLKIFNEKYAFIAYLIYAVIGLIVFSIWLYKGFVKKSPKVKLGEVFGVKSVIALVCAVIGLYFFINAFMTIADKVIPQAMEEYAELIEASGLASDALITIVYGIILGPILEELCFRGVTYGLLEKAGVKPGVAITVSAVLFGAMHLIIVQVLYAAFLGLILGYMRYKYRSIKITVLTHILFNLMGTYGGLLLQDYIVGDAITLICGGVGMIVVVIALILINSDNKALKTAK